MKRCLLLLLILSLIIPELLIAQAQPTVLVVRTRAKDAKFIGSTMGGARITVRDADTGELLAKGFTKGSTGNTKRLMQTPESRDMRLSTPDAAKFETILSLSEPRLVTIEATVPYLQRQSQITASTQVWMIPGKDIDGDGIIMEIPGFSVDLLQPQAHRYTDNPEIAIRANVVMMCGCTTTPGGLWDSSGYEISAIVRRGDEVVATVPLSYAGEPSTYEASYTPESAGAYEVVVYAYDPDTGNTGVDKTSVIITQ